MIPHTPHVSGNSYNDVHIRISLPLSNSADGVNSARGPHCLRSVKVD